MPEPLFNLEDATEESTKAIRNYIVSGGLFSRKGTYPKTERWTFERDGVIDAMDEVVIEFLSENKEKYSHLSTDMVVESVIQSLTSPKVQENIEEFLASKAPVGLTGFRGIQRGPAKKAYLDKQGGFIKDLVQTELEKTLKERATSIAKPESVITEITRLKNDIEELAEEAKDEKNRRFATYRMYDSARQVYTEAAVLLKPYIDSIKRGERKKGYSAPEEGFDLLLDAIDLARKDQDKAGHLSTGTLDQLSNVINAADEKITAQRKIDSDRKQQEQEEELAEEAKQQQQPRVTRRSSTTPKPDEDDLGHRGNPFSIPNLARTALTGAAIILGGGAPAAAQRLGQPSMGNSSALTTYGQSLTGFQPAAPMNQLVPEGIIGRNTVQQLAAEGFRAAQATRTAQASAVATRPIVHGTSPASGAAGQVAANMAVAVRDAGVQPQSPLHETSPARGVIEQLTADHVASRAHESNPSALVTRDPAPQQQSPVHGTSPASGANEQVIAGQGPEAVQNADDIVAANSAVAVRDAGVQPQSPVPGTSPVRGVIEQLAADTAARTAERATADATALAPRVQPQSPVRETLQVPGAAGQVIAGHGERAVQNADDTVAANSAVAVRDAGVQPQSPVPGTSPASGANEQVIAGHGEEAVRAADAAAELSHAARTILSPTAANERGLVPVAAPQQSSGTKPLSLSGAAAIARADKSSNEASVDFSTLPQSLRESLISGKQAVDPTLTRAAAVPVARPLSASGAAAIARAAHTNTSAASLRPANSSIPVDQSIPLDSLQTSEQAATGRPSPEQITTSTTQLSPQQTATSTIRLPSVQSEAGEVASAAIPQPPATPQSLAADAANPETGSGTPGASPGPRPSHRTAEENAETAAASKATVNTITAGAAVLGALGAAAVVNAARGRTASAAEESTEEHGATVDPTTQAQAQSQDQTQAVNPNTALGSITVASTARQPQQATKKRKPLLSPDDTFAAYGIKGGFDAKVTALTQLKSEFAGISDPDERAKKQLEITKAENMLRKGRETGGQYREHAAIAKETVPAKQPKQSTGTPAEPSPYEIWLCEEAKKQYDSDNTPKAGSNDPKKTFAELTEEEQHKYTKQYVYENRSAKLGDYHASLSSAGNIQGILEGNRSKNFATSEGTVKFSVNLDGTLKTEVEGKLNAVVSVRRRLGNNQLSDQCDLIEFKDGKIVGFHLNTDAPGTTSQLDIKQLEGLKVALDAKTPTPAVPSIDAAVSAVSAVSTDSGNPAQTQASTSVAASPPASAVSQSGQTARPRSQSAPGANRYGRTPQTAERLLSSAAGAQQTQHATRDAVTATPIPTRLASQSAPGGRTPPTAERLLSSAAAGAQPIQHATPLQQPGDRTQQHDAPGRTVETATAAVSAASAAAASAARTSTQQHAPDRTVETATAAVSAASTQMLAGSLAQGTKPKAPARTGNTATAAVRAATRLGRTFGPGTSADGTPLRTPPTPGQKPEARGTATNPLISVRGRG